MRIFQAELLGTFIIVFVGCGAVGLSIFSMEIGLLPMAIIWGIGVAGAIYLTRNVSGAHLNPAVSLSMGISGDLEWEKLLQYLLAQFLGAFFAAAALYYLFANSIAAVEQEIARFGEYHWQTGKMFGEYFRYSEEGISTVLDPSLAFALELGGTALLLASIYFFVKKIGVQHWSFPLVIGGTVSVAILLIAPYTQAGITPARDLAPRIFAYLAGWGSNAWAEGPWNSVFVYVSGPLCASVLVGGTIRGIRAKR